MHNDVDKTEGRIRNTLEQRLRSRVVAERESCSVSAFECGEPVPVTDALSATLPRSPAGPKVGCPVVDNLVQGLRPGAVAVEGLEGRSHHRPWFQ